MHTDLTAPPKFSLFAFTILVVVLVIATFIVSIFYALRGTLPWSDLAIRTVIMLLLSGASVWGYAHLMRYARLAPPQRMPIVHAVSGTAAYLALYFTLGVTLSGTFLGTAFGGILWMAPFMFGLILATGGFARRFGDSLHCPKCDYEFTFTDMPDPPRKCPECGTPWRGSLRKGRRLRSSRLIATGAAIALFSLVAFQPIFYMGFLAPHLPTPLLYATAYSGARGMYDAWDELAMRNLSPEWTSTLGERVITLRRLNPHDPPPLRWFDSMVAAGKIPQDLAERYYREAFIAHLEAPTRVKVGQPFPVALRVTQSPGGGTSNLGIWFAGYALGDDEPAIAREKATVWGFRLQPRVFDISREALPATLTATAPGKIRGRAIYWIVFEPLFTEELQWQPDGTPAKPAKALWFERIELTRDIEVE